MSTQTEPALTPTTAAGPERNDRIRLVAVLVAIGGVLLLAITAVALLSDGGGDGVTGVDPGSSDESWGGTLLAPAPGRPDFTLTDTGGRPYDFGEQTGGELTLLFFGYTYCPDICPVQMSVLSDALDTPGIPRANVVFVTTDPDRDTADRLRHWLDQLPGGEAFVGLRGTIDQVAAAESAAGVAPSFRDEAAGGSDGYEVGHAAQIMAYTPDDKAHLAYPSGVRSQDWLGDLPRMMERWGDSPATPDPAGADPAPEDEDEDEGEGDTGATSEAVTAGDITVRDAFAAASDDLTAVYLTIDNGGGDDTLVGVGSAAASDVTLMSGSDGAGMEDAGSVDIPDGTTAFASGGAHIMVTLDDPVDAGDTLPLELEFASTGKVTVDVALLSRDDVVDRIERGGDG